MKQHAAILGGLLAVVGLMSLLISPVARSQPVEPAGVIADPTLPLGQLGSRPNLEFYGAQGIETLVLPVPPGLTPVTLNAITQLPVNVRSGTITVMQGDRTIARLDIAPGERAPIVIPLAGTSIEDNAVSVVLRTYLSPVEGYCLDPSNPLRLSDISVSFAGVEETPDTVADFLPPVLRQLTIFLDDRPTRAEADAAVRMAASITAQYGAQNPEISVVSLPRGERLPPELSAPLQRHIVIRELPDAGASLPLIEQPGVPPLLISGSPEELENQSRLLSSDLDRLALASKAVAGPLRSVPQLPPDETTLRRLGQPGVNATALSPQVNIGLDQTRIGRSVHGVRVHLRGSHTPLPENIGGQVVVSIGAEQLDRWPADASGELNRWIDIPDEFLERYTNLGVRLDISGDTGRCSEFQPLTLTVDGDSPVVSSRAHPPVPGGLQSLPQSLMPRTTVGIGEGIDDVRRAVTLMVGLQRLSALPIEAVVTSIDEALSGAGPAVLVSPRGWNNGRIALPIEAGAEGELTVVTEADAEPTTLTLTSALPYASLQTVIDGSRTLLVATSNDAPQQLDALLDWVVQNPQRWTELDGTAVIAAPDRQPVAFGTAPQPQRSDEASTRPPLWLWAAAGLGLVGLILVVGVAVARLRRKPGPSA